MHIWNQLIHCCQDQAGLVDPALLPMSCTIRNTPPIAANMPPVVLRVMVYSRKHRFTPSPHPPSYNIAAPAMNITAVEYMK